MAISDYITCCKCGVKLIYDGNREQRDWWEQRWNKEPEIECPDCKTEQAQPVALEAVYETIIQWDEGGGKRSRRELARRIVSLYTAPPPRQQYNATSDHQLMENAQGDIERVKLVQTGVGIGQTEQAQPVAWMDSNDDVFFTEEDAHKTGVAPIKPLYTAPPPRQPLTDEQAYDMGAKGGEPTEAERLLFEAWMRGHCWAVVGEWDGKTYVHKQESTGFVNASAMNTRQLWAAWRDRAALEAAHGIKGEE